MKVILLSPPYIPGFMRNGRCDYVSISYTQWYPIWLSYCGALLEKYGHCVELIDAPAERLNYKQALKRITGFVPDMLVVYSSTKSMESDILFAETIKEKINISIVFAGPYVSADPQGYIDNAHKIDVFIRGEFDYPVLELANGADKAGIKNLIWRKGEDYVTNETAPPLDREKLDNLPFVADFYRRHLNIRNYRVPSELYPFLDIFTGRGCYWGRCSFCLWPQAFTRKSNYSTRSIENVIAELKFVKQEMPAVKEVFIQDDTLPQWRIKELSGAILDGGLSIRWSCYTRADLDYPTLKMMKESGCFALHVGYESAEDSILKKAGKGIDSERMTQFTHDARRVGLHIHGDFLIGLPGETEASVLKTINWARKLDPDTAQFLQINPYRSTALFDLLASRGWLKEGGPDYPVLSKERILRLKKRAYRSFYLSVNSLKKIFFQPDFYLLSRPKSVLKFMMSLLDMY